jgi:pimeloyl-ACP methyl ester carboxylesterase
VGKLDGIWWSDAGQGRAVVVPWLNADWSAMDLSALTDRFRVVLVAPLGFGPSVRPGSYQGTWFLDDIERVLQHLGIERYATFGYSMNGAMAARLAVDNPRVTAVACGGFPLTADLTAMGRRARQRNTVARQDAESRSELEAAYDPEAAVAFWDDIGRLPHAALAEVECPIRVWWGDRDAVVGSLVSHEELARDLASHGIAYDVMPGLDHTDVVDRLDVILPTIASWLTDQSSSWLR